MEARQALNKTFVFAFAMVALPVVAERIDFMSKPMLAGRASLAGEGYVERRLLGVANFSPELRYPIELAYDSSSEKTGA